MARKAAAHVKEGALEIEAPAVSLENDVEIDLAESGNGVTPPKQAAAPQVPDIEVVPAPAAAPVVSAQEDEEKASMRKRLQELEAAERVSRETVVSAQAAQAESVRLRQLAEARSRQFEQDAAQAVYDSTVNTMGAAQSEFEAAKQALEVAGQAGDWKAIADAQERIGRYSSDLQTLEREKNRMDAMRDAEKNRPPPQPQPQQHIDPVEANIAHLPERAKVWLRNHREYMTEPEKNDTLRHYHWIAKREAGGEFNDAYFDRMEVHLGFRQETQQSAASAGQNGTPSAPQRSVGQVSAPPTREAPSMVTGRAPAPTRITLSPEQRQVAASIAESHKISQAEAERIYARNLIKINQEKASGERT